VLPVFLTRDGQQGSHPAYYSVSYSGIHEVLTAILRRNKAGLPPDIVVAIRHYVQVLEHHIMEDTNISVLAQRIYKKHKRALDIILEHRPDALEIMRQDIVSAIQERGELRLVHSSKTIIQFVPVAWDKIPELHEGSDGTWKKQKDILRFEFKQQTGLTAHLYIGPGDQDFRTKLHDESGKPELKALFTNRNKRLEKKWSQLFRLAIYSKKEDASLTIEEKHEKFEQTWSQFCDGALPRLTQVFVELLSQEIST